MEHLEKNLRDALLIIHYGINRTISKKEIEQLIARSLITPKHPEGWMTNSLGREVVRRLK